MKAIGLWCGLAIGMLALAGPAAGAPEQLAHDEAGNYTVSTFTNQSNLGTGYGAWDLWNTPASLGDSTAGGGGDLNSTNGYSFRFMGDGAGGWCNGRRNLSGALQAGDVLSFTFTYNWDGGGRGVDIFSATGQFANVIDVSGGNTFKVNGTTISTEWSPGAVVSVQITQQADGIQVHLTRATNGTENLNYTTNILNAAPATGFSLYCGGYSCLPIDNVNYAIFMNDIEITGEPRVELTFTDGVWNPAATGAYAYVLARTGGVSNDLVLTSSNTNAVVVPAAVSFAAGSNSVSFNADVISLTAGPATIVASNADTGAWAEYVVTPVAPLLTISGEAVQISGGVKNYTLERSASAGTNILLFSSNTGVVTVPVDLVYGAGAYSTTFPATFLSYGSATLTASNPATGAAATFNVTYQAPKLTVTGLRSSWVGGDELYKVTREGAVGDGVTFTSSDTNVMTVPAMGASFMTGENTLYFEASAVGAGTVALGAFNDDATSDGLSVAVEAAPDFAAYDDALLYAGGDWVLAPAHGSGFADWVETLSAEQGNSFRGRFIGTGLIRAINEGGAAFGLYANYSGAVPSPLPEVKVSRAFPAPMATGQVFSVDVGYNWNSGTKGFKLKGEFEGNAYERFELFNSGNDTWSYKLDGGTPVVIWNGYIPGGFVGRVQAICTAPNTFTFSFLQEGAAAPTLVEDVALPGTIDQVEFYSYNGGSGDAENFTFNRMWLSAAEGPGPAPEIEPITYSGGNLVCPVPAGFTNGTVYGADCALTAGDWGWVVLTNGVDYTVSGGAVTIPTAAPAPGRRIIRVDMIAMP